MRQTRLALFVLAAAFCGGCIYGRGQATTTTTHRLNDGVHPIWEESVTRTYSGSSFGASVPDIGGPGTNGAALQIGGAGNCATYGNCTGYETVIFGQVAGGAGVPTVTFVPGGTQTVAPGAPVGYAPPTASVDDEQVKRLDAVIAVLKQMSLTECRQILAHPEVFQDEAERERQVRDCTESLKKHTDDTKSKED